ncbi:phospholipid transport system substrate-binding protein [Nitrosomonas sp. Nm84]|uniref:MlaC/ttg2D family ABC transporter substrate-binding protein n=1 Tax=Nitrosomonas sp. Nm84 TaxID=200124 RepID=UPI000D775EB3|nr:ABC transporter substrate-binding protein [Nitrosomonas sp. Nm84]PXW89669.1 phospholipid transport system substrate-binding protein [Nitrosomonas sp. Nm84]
MKRFFGIILLIFSNLLVFPAWSADLAPDRLVDETVKEVIEIIQKDEQLKNGNKEKMLDLIETKILPHFNFTRMTQLAMGQHWSAAVPDQQKKLVDEFRTLLVRTYSNALTSYNHETIKVNPLKQLGNNVETTVRTVVIQGNGKEPVPIDYSMEKKSDGWKVYDVTVAGVSLVTNYRGSFNSQVRKGGVEGLIKTLSDKNKSLEGKK